MTIVKKQYEFYQYADRRFDIDHPTKSPKPYPAALRRDV